jgi:hypothetical protein
MLVSARDSPTFERRRPDRWFLGIDENSHDIEVRLSQKRMLHMQWCVLGAIEHNALILSETTLLAILASRPEEPKLSWVGGGVGSSGGLSSPAVSSDFGFAGCNMLQLSEFPGVSLAPISPRTPEGELLPQKLLSSRSA